MVFILIPVIAIYQKNVISVCTFKDKKCNTKLEMMRFIVSCWFQGFLGVLFIYIARINSQIRLNPGSTLKRTEAHSFKEKLLKAVSEAVKNFTLRFL